MDGEMGLTPEELAGLTPEELAELRQVYAEGHAAGCAAGYADSYVRGVQDALTERGFDVKREVPPDAPSRSTLPLFSKTRSPFPARGFAARVPAGARRRAGPPEEAATKASSGNP